MCSPYSQAGGGHDTNRQFLGGPASTGTAIAATSARLADVKLASTNQFAVLLFMLPPRGG